MSIVNRISTLLFPNRATRRPVPSALDDDPAHDRAHFAQTQGDEGETWDCPDSLTSVPTDLLDSIPESHGDAISHPASPVTLEAGSEPVPGYRLVNRIGKGGTGVVWKAIGPGGFCVALKIIRVGGKSDSVQLGSLELMKDVRQAHLLPLFGAWRLDGLLIVGMELADGTLMGRFERAIIEGSPGIPFAELVEYMQQAARGIDFLNKPLHALLGREGLGIQHRDIKPQNLLLIGGTVKVSDFGLASVLDDLAVSTTHGMTPAYAAPEFFHGRTSSRSDQYSLAVTYFQLRTGEFPYRGNLTTIMAGHLLRRPDLSALPPDERAVVARAMAKRPEDRWPDCGTFVEQLRRCRGPKGPSRRGLSSRTNPGPIASRLKRAVVLLAIMGVTLASGFSYTRREVVEVGQAVAARDRGIDVGEIEIVPEETGIAGSPAPDAPVPIQASTHDPADTDEGLREADQGRASIRQDRPVATAIDRELIQASEHETIDEATERQAVARITDILPEVLAKWRKAIRLVAGALIVDRRPPGVTEATAIGSAAQPPDEVPGPDRSLANLADPTSTFVEAAPGDRPRPRPATIHVLMPSASAELVVRGEVGKGNPQEWYGATRVIHTPPLDTRRDYLVGAFWTDSRKVPLTRKSDLNVEPGRTYEVDLRSDRPTCKEISK